ncbi:MAG: Flp pilus assembly complex ATPase component TadA [Phycisphaerae bacterium]|nr:Flp pilus assembly complex ATPase component TadA [Phycisphaerae bacterium]
MYQLEKEKIGSLLCERSYIENFQLEQALDQQKTTSCRLGQILIDLGYITRDQLIEALTTQAGIEKTSISDHSPEPRTLSLTPAALVTKHNLMPLWQKNGSLAVAMADPFDPHALEDLRVVTGLSIERYYARPDDLEKAILKYYGSNVSRMLENLAPEERKDNIGLDDYSAAKLHELAQQPSLVNLVNIILLEAINAHASDIHVEPFEDQLKIKYRIDGILYEKSPSPKRLQAAIISRIKIMGHMNIAEHFVPQDGHIEFAGPNSKVDIRVSTVPTTFGESVTMRILDKSAALINLSELGMKSDQLTQFNQSLKRPHGIILVTGPTGSGKTTTLYSALSSIYTPSLKIITIEDPVEYQLNGIIQMPVNPKRGLSFATGLRHILRQDPDVIMVGEIRDRETADIAIRAAMTGHLVFSTLHTNNAAGAVTRLIDMGVEPFLLASSLEVVLAQRLVRNICPFCKEAYTPDNRLLNSVRNSQALPPSSIFYRGVGCDQCMNTGMKGRTGLFEVLRITDKLRQLISNKPTAEQIIRNASDNYVTMRHDGIEKILSGHTTPQEVLRVTQEIDEE